MRLPVKVPTISPDAMPVIATVSLGLAFFLAFYFTTYVSYCQSMTYQTACPSKEVPSRNLFPLFSEALLLVLVLLPCLTLLASMYNGPLMTYIVIEASIGKR